MNGPGAPAPSFGGFVAAAQASGTLVVQPRMGFSDPARMRAGLLATRGAAPGTAGTLTVDSYTRVGQEDVAAAALREGAGLNGYPITLHSPRLTREVLDGVHAEDFPVQVRHGSAQPQRIVAALTRAGLDATEGGPVSYCLPYGRTPLAESVRNWREACQDLAALRGSGRSPHLETFGGCLLGQLCPPGLLVALSTLEAVFFHRLGLRSISLSYAQQTSDEQDLEAIAALRRLAGEYLPGADWHVVLYTYMGLYPRTRDGAVELLRRSARLAVRGGAARLIVKTAAEAHRIPSVEENTEALRLAAAAAHAARQPVLRTPDGNGGSAVLAEARTLVEAVLGLDEDLGRALVKAFRHGYLDVPYCLHPDNAGRTRSSIDGAGRLVWSDTGAMPLGPLGERGRIPGLSAHQLYEALAHVRRRHDHPPAANRRAARPRPLTASARPAAPTGGNR